MPRDGWHPPIIRTVATENRGVGELVRAIDNFRKHFESGSERQKKQVEHWKNRLIEMLESRLLERVVAGNDGAAKLQDLAVAVAERKKDPFSAVRELLNAAGLKP